MTLEEAKKKITEKFKDGVIDSIMESDKNFIFQVVPKGWKPRNSEDGINDSMYSVNKNSGKIDSFVVFENIKEFNDSKMIYKR